MRTMIKLFSATLCGVLAACAIITVNVYFPEKDVKQAYKSLDEMLLKPGAEGTPETPALPSAPVTSPPEKPQSRLPLHFSLVREAQAAESIADDLAVDMADNPTVIAAYAEMKQRRPQIEVLLTSGAVGEGKQGILVTRDKALAAGKEELIKAENGNRKAVITAMARAIIKINKQPESAAAMNQVLAKAAASYATTRQEQARTGWWIELANGRWIQK